MTDTEITDIAWRHWIVVRRAQKRLYVAALQDPGCSAECYGATALDALGQLRRAVRPERRAVVDACIAEIRGALE